MRLIDVDALGIGKAKREVFNNPEYADGWNSAIDVINNAPIIEERKKGKWIDEPVYKQTMDGKTWDGYTYCSECGDMKEYGYRSSFCPNCGSYNGGEGNETD